MSAREELYALAAWGDDRTANEKIDAYRAEVLREAAEKIRRGWDETRGATQASKVMAFAADLIDPGEEN
jgi:hypothetical protein